MISKIKRRIPYVGKFEAIAMYYQQPEGQLQSDAVWPRHLAEADCVWKALLHQQNGAKQACLHQPALSFV